MVRILTSIQYCLSTQLVEKIEDRFTAFGTHNYRQMPYDLGVEKINKGFGARKWMGTGCIC